MEEISLKDILTIIWKGKWLIAIITAVAIILGLVYLFVFINPSYEAEAVIMVSPIQNNSEIDNIDTVQGILEYLTENPINSVDSYVEQIKLAPVIEKVADGLDVDKTSQEYVKNLQNKISINSSDKSNLIHIMFKDENGDVAKIGANMVADSFIEYISDVLKIQANTAIDFISEQYNIENSNVEESMNKLAAFLGQPRGVSELQGELDNSMIKINSYKSELRDIEIDIAYYTEGLAAVKDQIKETPEFITVIKAVGDDAILSAALMDNTNTDFAGIAEISMVEQIPNEPYTTLVSNVNDYEIRIRMDKEKLKSYEKSLIELQNEIEVSQAELALKETESEVLQDKVSIAKASRELYQNELKTIETKLVADIGERSVVKISDAINYEAVGTSKAMIMIIVTILGAMIGVFAVFIKNSFKEDDKEDIKNS